MIMITKRGEIKKPDPEEEFQGECQKCGCVFNYQWKDVTTTSPFLGEIDHSIYCPEQECRALIRIKTEKQNTKYNLC
jgi:hypothetical protein